LISLSELCNWLLGVQYFFDVNVQTAECIMDVHAHAGSQRHAQRHLFVYLSWLSNGKHNQNVTWYSWLRVRDFHMYFKKYILNNIYIYIYIYINEISNYFINQRSREYKAFTSQNIKSCKIIATCYEAT
jgi:hypothetical protein